MAIKEDLTLIDDEIAHLEQARRFLTNSSPTAVAPRKRGRPSKAESASRSKNKKNRYLTVKRPPKLRYTIFSKETEKALAERRNKVGK